MPKKEKSYRELYNSLAVSSECATTIVGSTRNPTLIHIRFRGPIANTPALKNEKLKGTNILRNKAKAILDLMTRAFEKSVNFQIPQYDAKFEVFCLVVCAYRKVSFDEDNVLVSIRDWLEPKHIRQRDRGWGAGVVKNDRWINAYAIKKNKSSVDADITEIFIRPMTLIEKAKQAFLKEVTNGIVFN